MGKQKQRHSSVFDSRMCRYTTIALGATVAVCAGAAQAQSSTGGNQDMSTLSFPEKFEKQVVEGTEVHGRVGLYDFRRWHDTNQPYPGQSVSDDQRTLNTNYGAQITLKTGRLYGFSAGGQFVYEDSLYHTDHPNYNLAYDGAVSNLTAGYLQFNAYGFQLRGGRQFLNTPMAGMDQFTFLPRSFNGVSAIWRPLQTMNRMAASGPQADHSQIADTADYETNQYMPFDLTASSMDQPEWQIIGAKIDRYEGRGNSDHFVTDNRYFTDVAGFWTLGTTYHNVTDNGQYIAQYYHYRFQQTESADYGEIGYMAPTRGTGTTAWAPYVRAQIMAAYDANKSRIPQGINSQIYGLKVGVDTPLFGFSVFGNFSPEHDDSFNHGQLLHPYTDLSGVLYTDTMNDGIQQIGPGWALGARIDFTPTDNLSMYARYVQYEAKHGHYHDFYFNGGNNNVIADDRYSGGSSFVGNEVDNQKSHGIGVGITYDLGGVWDQLAGLKVGDALGVTVIDGAPTFYNNRVRFYYEF